MAGKESIKGKLIAFWVITGLLAFGMLSGGISQPMKFPSTVAGIIHLGYPKYFLNILGTWKILGVIAILIPKYPLLKEWAYAGFFFAMTGAVVSYIASGYEFKEFIAPLIFAVLTCLSWYLRPANRRIVIKIEN